MFYTHLRGLVAFILWVLNGNAHYHHKGQYSRSKRELHLGIASPDLVGSGLYGLCDQAKAHLSLWQKRALYSIVFLAGGFVCGAFPIDRENPGAEAIKYPVNMLKKSNRS